MRPLQALYALVAFALLLALAALASGCGDSNCGDPEMASRKKLRPRQLVVCRPLTVETNPFPISPSPPTLTAPAGGAVLGVGSSVTLSATSPDGDLDRIEWILDPAGAATVIGTDSAAPYSQSWTVSGSQGAHQIKPRSFRGGLSTDGAAASVTLASYPVPLADFPSSGITQSAGRLTSWAGSGGKTWVPDTSQVYFIAPVYVANMANGNAGAQFDGQTLGARTIMKLASSLAGSAGPVSFGIVTNNTRDQASPIATRGYYFESGLVSTEPVVNFPEVMNDASQVNLGFGSVTNGGWIPALETNFDGSSNKVSVEKGLQVLVWSINPGVTDGSFLMRNGVVIGHFTVANPMAIGLPITLGAGVTADNTDVTYARATFGDHAVWNVTLTEAQAIAWSQEKITKFGVSKWPPVGQVLPTWANIWYDASRPSDLVREADRAITKIGNRAALGTHTATQSTAADKAFLQPSAAGSLNRPGMVFGTTDNYAAHTIAALIDGTDDFTIAILARATGSGNSDGRMVRSVNSGGGSALITLENPYVEPPVESVNGIRHDGTNNVTNNGPSGNTLVHFFVLEKTGNNLRLGRDGLYRTVTQTQASITIDQFFIGGGAATQQEIYSIAIKAGGNATAQQLLDEHARGVVWWGCRAQPTTEEPWLYGATLWVEPSQAASYHEDGSAAGTADVVNNLSGTPAVSFTQATDANNPAVAGTGNGVYFDFDGTNDEVISGQQITNIINNNGWEAYAVVWIDAIDTVSANFDANDVIIGDVGFWGIHLRNNSGTFQVQAGQWDGARKVAVGTVTLGAWHTVHAWYDGANINIEIDGVAGSSAAAGNVTTVTGLIKIGGTSANTTQQLDGKIRHIQVAKGNYSAGARTAMAARCNAIRDAA